MLGYPSAERATALVEEAQRLRLRESASTVATTSGNNEDWASMRFPPLLEEGPVSNPEDYAGWSSKDLAEQLKLTRPFLGAYMRHRRLKPIRLLRVNGFRPRVADNTRGTGSVEDRAAGVEASSSGEHTDESILDCTLAVFSLSDERRPAYEAISYTWGMLRKEPIKSDGSSESGKSRGQTCIRVNGHEIPLAKNLHDLFLLHWQRLQRNHVWIDQICIDQENKWEKSQQIRLMSDIYRSAAGVIIWLEKDEKDLKDFLLVQRTISHLVQKLLKDQRAEWIERHGSDEDFNIDDILQLDYARCLQKYGYGLGPTPAQWQSWHQIFQRRWFRRVWTVEEHRLAPKFGKTFLCGQREIEWVPLLGTLYYVLRCRSCRSAACRSMDKIDHLETVYQFLDLDEDHVLRLADLPDPGRLDALHKASRMESSTLLTMMQITRSLGCTDPRDRVYGIAALGRMIPNVSLASKAFGADYTATVEKVSFRVTTHLLKVLSLLNVLSLIDNSARDPSDQSPSWTLDLRHKARRFEWSFAHTWFNRTPAYNACIADPEVPSHRTISGTKLRCRGGRIGSVFSVVRIKERLTGHPELMTDLLEMCLEIPLTRLRGCKDRFEVLWRTLIGDVGREEYHPSSALAAGFKSLAVNLLLQRKAELKSAFGGPLETTSSIEARYLEDLLALLYRHPFPVAEELPSLARAQDLHFLRDKVAPEIEAAAEQGPHDSRTEYIEALKCNGKSVILSTSGSLGLAPLLTQPRDEIWLLENGRTPFILRSAGEDADGALYTLVGEAFVYGAMQGEYMVPAMTHVPKYTGGLLPSFEEVVWEDHYAFCGGWQSIALI